VLSCALSASVVCPSRQAACIPKTEFPQFF
jgi:hypothetical protein